MVGAQKKKDMYITFFEKRGGQVVKMTVQKKVVIAEIIGPLKSVMASLTELETRGVQVKSFQYQTYREGQSNSGSVRAVLKHVGRL